YPHPAPLEPWPLAPPSSDARLRKLPRLNCALRGPRVSPLRVRVGNPSDGGFFFWLVKLYAFSAPVVLVALLGAAVGVYGHYARSTPSAPDLRQYATVAPAVTRVFAGDGSLLGEFAEEWREVVAYEKLPPKLIQAFISAEDHDFFEHGGIYF